MVNKKTIFLRIAIFVNLFLLIEGNRSQRPFEEKIKETLVFKSSAIFHIFNMLAYFVDNILTKTSTVLGGF